jgi:hypothetical protein
VNAPRRIVAAAALNLLKPDGTRRTQTQQDSIMKKIIFISALSLVTAVSAGALACGGGMGAKADTNGDGKISLDEATAKLKTRFSEADANKDGAVTTAELGERGKRMFDRADANKDAKVTLVEAQTALNAWFAKRDANGDKVISGDEMHKRGHGHGKGRGPRA